LLLATKTSIEAHSLLAATVLMMSLTGAHFFYAIRRPNPLFSAATGGLAVLIWGGLSAGVIALAALRTGAPLIDSSLAAIDEAMRLHTPYLVTWFAAHPLAAAVLARVYETTVPAVFVAVLILAFTGREAQMWQACSVFVIAAAVCGLVSAVLPAAGAFAHYGTSPNILATLPAGAGRFHLKTFEAYRSGAVDSIDLSQLQGVVTFPSFHAVMALIATHALQALRGPLRLIWLWCALVLISTILIGGHYAVDLLAGGALWGVLTHMAAPKPRPVQVSEAFQPGPPAPQPSTSPLFCTAMAVASVSALARHAELRLRVFSIEIYHLDSR
jgi:membrane-associated phospholipid phosphatase